MIHLKKDSKDFQLDLEIACSVSDVPMSLVMLQADFAYPKRLQIVRAIQKLIADGWPIEFRAQKNGDFAIRRTRPFSAGESMIAETYWNTINRN